MINSIVSFNKKALVLFQIKVTIIVFLSTGKMYLPCFPSGKTTQGSETSIHVSGHQETVLLSKAATMTMHYFR